jgi:hypothetical protein
MAIYPTKEKILKTPYKHLSITLELVNIWKKDFYQTEFWKENKIKCLEYLIGGLSHMRYITNVTIGKKYCYQPNSKTIVLDKNNPSIISTLHEYAHHILGPDELEACRWSVWLFKKCFPNEYAKLTWKGHMLKKPCRTSKFQPV